jgi:hypothetical protein
MTVTDEHFNQESRSMSLPTNGITPEVIREMMPPYQLSADLLAAMFASIPAPPPDATQAWRQERAARLVQEVAGLMPADAPQARIAAALVIVREATDDTFARVSARGLTVEQICRLRRTGSALTNSSAALERMLVRHQQKPVPFFGTVLAEGIDVAALAAGWGGAGSRRDEGEALGVGGGGGASTDGLVPVGMAGTTAGTSPPGQAPGGKAYRGQALWAMTRERGPDVAMEAGPDDAVASGGRGGSKDGQVRVGMAGTSPAVTINSNPAVTVNSSPAMTINSSPAMTVEANSAVTTEASPARAAEKQGAPGPRQDAGAAFGVVTRLDQGPGWTLDVSRPRMVGDVVGANEAIGAAPEQVA